MFFPFEDTLYRIDNIQEIRLAADHIDVFVSGRSMPLRLTGFWMFHLLGQVCPEVIEGSPLYRWKRNAWAIHNLVGHPLLQVLSWAGRTKLGIRIHDLTVPGPVASR